MQKEETIPRIVEKIDTIVISRIDTLYIDRVDPKYHEVYAEILEKANNQLSLVGNPLAWFIGALGVLFAAGAIVSAILIWRQSKNTKEQFVSLFEGSESRILDLEKKLNDAQRKLLEQLKKETEEAISTIKSSLEKSGDSESQILKKLEEKLEELNEKSKDLEVTGYGIQNATESIYSNPPKQKTCSACGLNFVYRTNNPFYTPATDFLYHRHFGSTTEIKCPRCGHVELV